MGAETAMTPATADSAFRGIALGLVSVVAKPSMAARCPPDEKPAAIKRAASRLCS